ncbi:esterase YqiA [Aestuariibacter sp. AA17]|uniref:Esterase YqiA n=1 Tax=Fluctibacter corallii TaxID=2984329 RepID=A0ABT3A5Q7_9ALTE|nr:YqiA/YcfP family alpha/beta fold hydrolase [Aestuariibacter sp. AA17]MCV2883597.1 esterase YqiA [Aestuariibacter sp. AA17]
MQNIAVVYLHGFLSSPQSVKAQQTKQFVETHYPHLDFVIPALPNTPDGMLDVLASTLAPFKGRELRFIGSSMGGFLSTYLVEQFGGKAVLINPAVKPYTLFADYLGHHVNPYTKQAFHLTQRHVDMIQQWTPTSLITPEAYWVLLQEGDETLDYSKAIAYYQGAKYTVEAGGDHSFQGYERYLSDIFRFLLAE